VAYAGASVDGRNQGQKSLNVDVPEESLGMARLMDALPATFFFLLQANKSGRHLMTLVGHKGAGTTFWEGRQLLMEQLRWWYAGV